MMKQYDEKKFRRQNTIDLIVMDVLCVLIGICCFAIVILLDGLV